MEIACMRRVDLRAMCIGVPLAYLLCPGEDRFGPRRPCRHGRGADVRRSAECPGDDRYALRSLVAVEAVYGIIELNVGISGPGVWSRDADFGAVAVSSVPHLALAKVDGKTNHLTTYTLDDALLLAAKSASAGPRIRLFGYSYTFGVGLADCETLQQAFANLAGANVENYSSPGYITAQTLCTMQKGLYKKDIGATSLLVLMTALFHADRVACLPARTAGAPHYALKEGKLTVDGRCRFYPWQLLAAYQRLLAPLVERPSRADVETYIAVVDAIAYLARTKYRVPVIVLDMEREDPSYLARIGYLAKDLDALFRAAGAIVVPDDTIMPLAVLRIPGDGHPNGEADRHLAHIVAKAIILDAGIELPRFAGDGSQTPEAK